MYNIFHFRVFPLFSALFRSFPRSPLLGLFLAVMLFSACADHGTVEPDIRTRKMKVAVLMAANNEVQWRRTAEWAMENIAEAQSGMTQRVELQLEFHDQDADDIDQYMKQIATDTTVAAIIGPTTSERAMQMAQLLEKHPKPMLCPSATNVEYQRKYANNEYIWNMAESDLSQLEVLISSCSSLLFGSLYTVSLLAPDEDNVSNTDNVYADWFGFIAEEFNIQVKSVMLYNNDSDIRRYARELCQDDLQSGLNIVIFCPSKIEDTLTLDDEIGLLKQQNESNPLFFTPTFYCTDAFKQVEPTKIKHGKYEGVDLYANPESGFNQYYFEHFGTELINGEAQFYDAICMLAYAATMQFRIGLTLNDALTQLVLGNDCRGGSWMPADMARNLDMLTQAVWPKIEWVSGAWSVNEKTREIINTSTFRRWRHFDGEYVTIEYASTAGSRRSMSSTDMWNWTATNRINLDDQSNGADIVYPPLQDRWAFLIAASNGWANYRFQADTWAMYRLLRENNYPDDHIILIAEDDVANNPLNTLRPDLRIFEGGPNIYDPKALDYKLSSLQPRDIGDILCGRSSTRLPHVITPSENDNVFIFWSGHGAPGSLDFGDEGYITYNTMRDILANMPHRKTLVAIEACYSGGLGERCVGVPGTLFLTAASPYETSHADVMSETLGVYLSNGFTQGLFKAIDHEPDISLRDLYYNLALTTTGSHVKIYNIENYGNVYRERMSEFLKLNN